MTKSSKKSESSWEKITKIALGGALAVLVLFLALVWPTITAEVKGVPIVVAGPPGQAEALKNNLQKAGDTFALSTANNREEAVSLIKQREAFGAIVLGSQPEVLTASANGPVAGQVVGALATQIQATLAAAQPTAPKVTVTDVVPLAEGDERGLAFASAVLPLALGGLLGGAIVSMHVTGVRRKLAALAAFSLLAGLVMAWAMQGWLNLIPGNYLVNSFALALAILATSAFVAGMHAVLGKKGIGLSVVTIMLVANPLSGASLPSQFLLEPWGTVGQYFTPGAGLTLLKDVAYFPGASITLPALVLTAWALLGMGLVAAKTKKSHA